MSDAIDIPLHRSDPPGLGQVVGWLVAVNLFVVITVALVVVIIPWLGGHQPELRSSTLLLSGIIVVALTIGFIWFANRRHQQRQLAKPRAHLVVDATSIALRRADGERVKCARAEAIIEPVHAHEKLRNVEYYLGPALHLQLGAVSFVVSKLDGAHRWGHDPRHVHEVDWICGDEPWSKLLQAFELDDALVASTPDGTSAR